MQQSMKFRFSSYAEELTVCIINFYLACVGTIFLTGHSAEGRSALVTHGYT